MDYGEQQQVNVDMSQTTEVKCENCSCDKFEQVIKMRRLSAILSPTGKEALIPMPVFACKNCGHVNEEFLFLPQE
jgi:uncharacterized Zn finger protein